MWCFVVTRGVNYFVVMQNEFTLQIDAGRQFNYVFSSIYRQIIRGKHNSIISRLLHCEDTGYVFTIHYLMVADYLAFLMHVML